MSRVQLALRASDLEGSMDFYRSVFEVEPAKRRPGYANFAENDTTCCYVLQDKLQDKVWVHGPGDEPWEVYTVKADAPAATSVRPDGGSGPCECGTA
jgi:predicted enzyme related to lactoylglutathione lyase